MNTLSTVRMTLQQLQDIQREQERLIPERPATPTMLQAIGLKLGARIQWSQVNGADGYRVIVMTTNNLHAPDYIIDVPGEQTITTEWFTGDVAVARQFTVQSYKRTVNGETLSSEVRYPFVSATSKIDGGAADSAPAASPSAPVAPSGSGTPPAPGGIRQPDEGTEIPL